MDKIHEIFHHKANSKLNGNFELCWKRDDEENRYGWVKLKDSADIENIAVIVNQMNGRVIAITAYFSRDEQAENILEIAYHFKLSRYMVTAVIELPSDNRQVSSITGILKSASIHEKQIQALHHLNITCH